MTDKVFIGGSRRITRINPMIRTRLDRIIERSLPVVIGDANGADKAVQGYLRDNGYPHVEVFCMQGKCRNNLGDWKTRVINAPSDKRGFEFYSLKDTEMTNESTVGLMLWDGSSRGTLANVSRMVGQHKTVVVYIGPLKAFQTIRGTADLERLLSTMPRGKGSSVPRGRKASRTRELWQPY